MKKQEHERTLGELFKSTEDAITEPYEVVRTIGFQLEAKGGSRKFRLEAIKRPGKESSSVLVWQIKENGTLQSYHVRQPTLDRVHPDLALRSMVKFIRQHYADFSKIVR
ncbi:MAG: hypothetical protein LAP85_10500 [Acidobacteriia bacterium]|nr:hypothetical protein [Terriglobia bacterium]